MQKPMAYSLSLPVIKEISLTNEPIPLKNPRSMTVEQLKRLSSVERCFQYRARTLIIWSKSRNEEKAAEMNKKLGRNLKTTIVEVDPLELSNYLP